MMHPLVNSDLRLGNFFDWIEFRNFSFKAISVYNKSFIFFSESVSKFFLDLWIIVLLFILFLKYLDNIINFLIINNYENNRLLLFKIYWTH
jgi:hypothetical protein